MRLTRADLVLTLGGVAVAACVTAIGGFGLPELVFFAVMLTSLALLSREAWRALRRERSARREAASAARVRADHVAAAAVRDERRRLSEDIAAQLRHLFTQVRREAAGSDDPGATARRIHRHARLASSELRRLLGLLRGAESSPDEGEPVPAAPPPRLPPRDLALAGAAAALALVESIAYPLAEDQEPSGWSVALTVGASITVAGRTRFPTISALAAAAVVALGATSALGVTGGFWMLLTATGLIWATVAVPHAGALRTASGVVFAAAVVSSAWLHDQENAGATSLVVCVLLAVAQVVRIERARAQQATRLADRYRSDLAAAAAAAVEADRAAFAREIHDSVSHAVGLIAMQAGAAEVSARRDPEAARRALELVAGAAAEALADLDRLHPDATSPGRTPGDVAALVDRIRAAGTPVTARGLDELPATGSDLVYRIVQEALTNVVRHGGGAPASITVEVDPDVLTVVVADTGPGARAPSGHGFGLVGLAERVTHAGGDLRTGAGPGGRGFVVEARLPATRAGVR